MTYQSFVNITEATNVNSGLPDSNYGNSTTTFLFKGGTWWRVYFKIGAGLEADFFKLKLYTDNNFDAITWNVYIAGGSWTEGALTWNNQPALGDIIATGHTNNTDTAYKEYEITGLTAQQISDINSYGILLSSPSNTGTYVDFRSDDFGSEDPQYAYGEIPAVDITKDLEYNVLLQKEITKSLVYGISIPKEITKPLAYNVLLQKEVTKPLAYGISIPKEITKSLKYVVPSAVDITKGLEYEVIKWYQPTKLTETVGSIIDGKLSDVYLADGIILELAETSGNPGFDYSFDFYGVSEAGDEYNAHIIAKNNGNVADKVKIAQWNFTTEAWVDLTANLSDFPYNVDLQLYNYGLIHEADYNDGGNIRIRIYQRPGIGDPAHTFIIDQFVLDIERHLTLTTAYDVVVPSDITKTLQYTIPTVGEVTKTLEYHLLFIEELTKGLEYKVVPEIDITKQLQYIVITELEVTKGLTYIIESLLDITKDIEYMMKPDIDVTKILQYEILTEIDINRVLEYQVVLFNEITKILEYAIVDKNDITKVLEYEIISAVGITKGLEYATGQTITKALQYSLAIYPYCPADSPYDPQDSPYDAKDDVYEGKVSPYNSFPNKC